MNAIIPDSFVTSESWRDGGDLDRTFGKGSSFVQTSPSVALPALLKALPVNVHDPVISALVAEIARLQRAVAELSQVVLVNSRPNAVSVRQLSDDTAKREIKDLFERRHGEILYPDEVAEELNIDVMQAVRVCEALDREGKIGKKASQRDTGKSA